MAGKFPESFADPLYAQVDSATEKKLELPIGLLSSIRTAGERSNASATNSLGTSSPYQFIPATRRAILDKYGIDVTLSPENASEGAGLLLQESLKRSNGDVETAVRQYHGGLDTSKWGPVNDAYAKRVLASQGMAKSQALSSGFAQFMANNPAVPAGDRTPHAAAPAAPVDDALSKGFGEFLAARPPAPGDIPGSDGMTNNQLNAQASAHPPADPSLVQKMIGSGEAGLTLLTGTVGGALGMVGGTLGGLAGSIGAGEYGTDKGVRNVEESAVNGMNGMTYHPRTQLGQEYAGEMGETMAQALPALPLTAEMGAIGRVAATAGRAGMDVAGAGLQRIRTASPAIAARVERTLSRNPLPEAAPAAAEAVPLTPEQAARLAQLDEHVAGAPSRRVTAQDGTPLDLPGRAPRRLTEAETAEQATLQAQRTAQEAADAAQAAPGEAGRPTPGTQDSGGSAGTDMMAQRRELAAQVGIEPTYGQLTRDKQQVRFEQETAKGPLGAKLDERFSQQHGQMERHFDHLVDMTGAEVRAIAGDYTGIGQAVDSALRKEFGRDKAQVRTAYQVADKSVEASAPVVLEGAVQFLNDSAPDQVVSPLLTAARARALKLGIATEDAAGNLVAVPTTVKNAELFRRAIGQATDYEPTNIRNSTIIKGEVDVATEPVAGPLYRNARRLRENLGNKYENRGVIADLLNKKRGMNDRKVEIEHVFKHSVLNASRSEMTQLRRILHGSEEGQQAWKELQGATVNWIKEQAFSNSASDSHGNTIISVPKLQDAVRKLEVGGKLKFILGGEQSAQHIRDLVDLAKVLYTTPPGAVNHSNTASVLLAAMTEAGVNGTMTGLPVPVLSALRMISVQVKNHRIRQRIDSALAGRASKNAPPPPAAPASPTLH